MPTIEARIRTDRPGRYLGQFRTHATAMASPRGHTMRMHGKNQIAHDDVRLRVDATDTLLNLHFDPWGRCLLRVDADALVVRIEADDDPGLQQIQDTVTRDLDRFGRHELSVIWQRVEDAPGESATAQ